MKYEINLPTINITDVESKISFTDGVYSPPTTKSPCEYNTKVPLIICMHIIQMRLTNLSRTPDSGTPCDLYGVRYH